MTSFNMLLRPRSSSFPFVVGICVLTLFLSRTAPAQPAGVDTTARAQLAEIVTDTLDAETFDGAIWGVQIQNLRTGEILFARNASTSFVPASNVKLLTAAAALEQLGPDYRYTTIVYADGPVEDGTLRGNLIVRGDGDPTLGGYRQRNDPTRLFREWADSLEEAGISRIAGNIIGDDDRFDDTPHGHGWSWEDLSHGYGAEIGGLVFNENKIDLTLRGRDVGQPARVRWTPFNTDYVSVINQSRTVSHRVEDDEEYLRSLGTNTIRVRTRLYPDAVEEASVAVANPTRYFAHTLREVLLRQGIAVGGRAADLDDVALSPDYDSDQFRPVATYTSPPLSQIVQTLNYESRNLYAEQLLRTLAVEDPPETDEDHDPGSSPLGIEAVRETLARAAVDTSQVELADGSGLSRQNLVSPQALVEVLQAMWVHDETTVSSAFYNSLPRGGEDGTLRFRFRGPEAAQGRVRAKTGTLSSVSSLSGYVTSRAGTPLAFSLLCNHHHADADQARAAQDVIVNALARLPL